MKPFAKLLYYNQINPDLAGLDFRGVRLKNPEDIIEYAGRWDYGEKNAQKLGQKSKLKVPYSPDGPIAVGAPPATREVEIPIIQKYIAMGHESMLEMGDATFFIECSRVVSHEIVRHRIASYQQESQRFVKYDDIDYEDAMYIPPEIENAVTGLLWDGNTVSPEELVKWLFEIDMRAYKALRLAGIAPQIARYVFPNAMVTHLIMKTNTREWRHICGLRLDKSAQPEMQEVMHHIYDQLVEIYPNVMHGILDSGRQVR